jgi:hypothetical protein
LEYEGTFELTTSRTSNTRLVDDLGWSRLDLLEKGHAIGTRQRLGQHNETLQGSLEVSTTNGDARVTFATPEYY